MGHRKRNTTWSGGFIRWTRGSDGKPLAWYVIQRRIHGVRYKYATGLHTEAGALAELERFEMDPAGYVPGGAAAGGPIHLDKDLADSFLAWSRDEKGNTPTHVRTQKLYLAWWSTKLRGLDLRKVSLTRDIRPALDGATTARRLRAATLKTLYSWLRKERNLILTSEDPCFGRLRTPATRVAQLTKSKVIPQKHILAARKNLVGHYRDALDILSGTGWHLTELARFAAAGTVEKLPSNGVDDGAAAILVCPQHKNRKPARNRVSRAVRDAAVRLREHGELDIDKFQSAVERACKAADIPAFRLGHLRHTVFTFAHNAGATMQEIADAAHHSSKQTTDKWYAVLSAPKKIPTLR